ncbi:MAG TPA: hypothetical protein VE553_05820 [Candidatus Binatia bacterium]|nr:hypothetical protein [Candidatus Binatia bacterium]
MRSQDPHEQRKRIAAFLAHQRTAVLGAIVGQGVWAMPIKYRPTSDDPAGRRSLELDCLVPRWADVAHHLSQSAEVLLVVQAASSAGLRWLQIQGVARPVEAPSWTRLLPRWVSIVQPDGLYLVVRVTPSRIDLVDEDLGWGVQETVEW